MKIGVLCEGENTDAPVIEMLLKHIFPDVSFEIKGVTKEVIFKAGDLELHEMFDKQRVDRAVIVWDLLPTGHQMGIASQWSQKPSRSEQRHMLLKKFWESEQLPGHLRQQAQHFGYRYQFYTDSEVQHPNSEDDLFKLVCVCYACDGWLLADGVLLKSLASTEARQASRYNPPHPDQCMNPAGELKRYFGQSPNRRLKYFNKSDHNKVIAQEYIQQGKVGKLETSESFQRIVQAIREWVGA
ncbi:MAG: hypothetical protein HC899_05210 [Leptolyngbyaceae cyanobacterium SM1_4_3]|nr:hypothetical protein [Leptolyngbyaceae cyanobacterium SM1_4_3]